MPLKDLIFKSATGITYFQEFVLKNAKTISTEILPASSLSIGVRGFKEFEKNENMLLDSFLGPKGSVEKKKRKASAAGLPEKNVAVPEKKVPEYNPNDIRRFVTISVKK